MLLGEIESNINPKDYPDLFLRILRLPYDVIFFREMGYQSRIRQRSLVPIFGINDTGSHVEPLALTGGPNIPYIS